MTAIKCIATKNVDGSVKLTVDGEWPELEAGERLELTLSPAVADSPAKEASDKLAADKAKKDAAKLKK